MASASTSCATRSIPVAILSGRQSAATTLRARELGITDVIQDPTAQQAAARCWRSCEEKGIGWQEVLYVGDDLPDVPVMRRVGIPVSVANGVAEVKAVAAFVTERHRGVTARFAKWWRHCSRHEENGITSLPGTTVSAVATPT